MIVMFILSVICDIALFFAFASPLSHQIPDVSAPTIVQLIILLATAISACLLYRIKPLLRYLPLLLLAFYFYRVRTPENTLLLLLPCIYIALTVFMENFSVSAGGLRQKTSICAAIILLPLVLIVVNRYGALTESFYFQSLLLYLCSAVCIFRITLYEQKTTFDARFIMINVAPAIGIFAALTILGSPQVLSVVWRAVRFVFTSWISPVLLFLAGVINDFFNKYFYKKPVETQFRNVEVPDRRIDPARRAAPEFTGPTFLFTQQALTIILVVAAILIFGWMIIAKARRKRAASTVAETRTTIKPTVQKASPARQRQFFLPRDPRLAVRYYYRQFLVICTDRGWPPEKSDTSHDIRIKNAGHFPDDDMSRLRALYIKARYSQDNVTNKESKEAGEAVKHMQKS